MCIYPDICNVGCMNSALLLLGLEGLVIYVDELHRHTFDGGTSRCARDRQSFK